MILTALKKWCIKSENENDMTKIIGETDYSFSLIKSTNW